MAEEELVEAVIFICPNCGFEEFDSVEELRRSYGFDGKNLKTLRKFDCHGCHRFRVKAKEFRKIPASWLEPF
jgi:transposase